MLKQLQVEIHHENQDIADKVDTPQSSKNGHHPSSPTSGTSKKRKLHPLVASSPKRSDSNGTSKATSKEKTLPQVALVSKKNEASKAIPTKRKIPAEKVRKLIFSYSCSCYLLKTILLHNYFFLFS